MGCAYPGKNQLTHYDSCSSVSSIPGIPRLVLPQSQKVLIRTTWQILEPDMTNIGKLYS